MAGAKVPASPRKRPVAVATAGTAVHRVVPTGGAVCVARALTAVGLPPLASVPPVQPCRI